MPASRDAVFPSIDVLDRQVTVVTAICSSDITLPSGYTAVLNITGTHPRTLFAYKAITSSGTEAVTLALASAAASR